MKKIWGKLKEENKILIMLALFSMSTGLWKNFNQLWMQQNGLEVQSISQILSVATLLCAFCILLFAKKIGVSKIQKFLLVALLAKLINLCILYVLHQSENLFWIGIFVITDVIIEKLITISIYPFIVTIKKEDTLYSKRKLVEYLFKDLGILIGGLCIGRTIGFLLIDYNTCLLLSILLLLVTVWVMDSIKQQKAIQEKEITIKQVASYVLKDNILKVYMVCYFVANIAMSTGLGLKMLMLTNLFHFTDSGATNYLLFVGLAADLFGILALKILMPKNDYITITIKFGIRFLLYSISFFTNNVAFALLAITWSIFISTAYENISDAPYINRVPNDYQLIFTDFRYMIGMLSTSLGMFFAGIMYPYGVTAILGLSAFFMVFQLLLCYVLVYMRKKEKRMEQIYGNI
ncbi:MAG: hypothetical protein ACLU84_06305 [Clostridia bacterium]